MAEQLQIIASPTSGGLVTRFFTCVVADREGRKMAFYMRPGHMETPLGIDCIPLNVQWTLDEMEFRAHWLLRITAHGSG